MKFQFLTIICLFSLSVFGQDDSVGVYKNGKIYYENNYEFLFQFGFIETQQKLPVKLRFSGFYHSEEIVHVDFARRVGFYTGVGLRNVGMIEMSMATSDKMKRRTYTLGVPMAVKIGSMKARRYLYGGAEMEMAFHYKQKLFVEGMKKEKYSEWFSQRVNMWQPSLFAGFKYSDNWSVRIKYYLNDFLNRSFTGRDFGQFVDYSKYKTSNLFYVALVLTISGEQLSSVKTKANEAKPVSSYALK